VTSRAGTPAFLAPEVVRGESKFSAQRLTEEDLDERYLADNLEDNRFEKPYA
jgi:hypothetical protein